MSDVQNTAEPTVAANETPVVAALPLTETPETSVAAGASDVAAPAVEAGPASTESKPVEAPATVIPLTEEKKDDAAPVAEEKKKVEEAAPAAAADKAVEPITEGQLAYKGPGLLKSLIPSKKEFWLSDEPVAPANLNLFMRGEKPEAANPVVAWASQTGKGLLFFSKKGDSSKKNPGGVLPLYEAVDLKKENPHEISFKIHGQEHTLKAANDAERDGWFLSLEKAIEMGKASKEAVPESEGYKAELEKLSKPAAGAIGVGAAKPSQSQPKKSAETDKAEGDKRVTSDAEEEKKPKARSTSRSMLNRLKSKKEDLEQKKEEKKEEKEEEKKEKEEAKEAKKEAEPTDETKAAEAAVPPTVVIPDVVASDDKKDNPAESTSPASKSEEKAKQNKRGSIFGKMSGWGSVKSPAKEKDQKEVEPVVDSKDAPVSENPPQLPEASTTAATEPVAATAADDVKVDTEAKAEEPKEEVLTPNKEKKNFLSGFGFAKRGRSVSPSQGAMEAPAKTEAAAPIKEETPVEAAKPEAEAAPAEETAAEQPAEKAEETPKTDATANKRQSMLGSLGRRASKAFKGMQAPRKENVAPKSADETKAEEVASPAETKPVDEAAATGETKPAEENTQQRIGDVVPDAVNVGQPQSQPPTVTASA